MANLTAGYRAMQQHATDRRRVVWLVASEHYYNMTNIGLNIHSDMLCDINKKRKLSRQVAA